MTKLCLVGLFFASYAFKMNYCMPSLKPLRLEYTAYNGILVLAAWNDVKGGFTVLPENLCGFMILTNILIILRFFQTPQEPPDKNKVLSICL